MITSSKESHDLNYYFVFFERSYVVPHSYKVSWLMVTWFRIYGWLIS